MEKITPTPLNPEKPFAVDRATAVSEAIPALSSLPLRRAAAIHEAIRTLIKTKGGVMIRRNVANLIAQYINTIKKIYLHNIPRLPKDQNFALINDKIFLAKIVDL